MQNKKGLSDVVTTVLIILLSIVAVVVVGSYVLGLVNSSSQKAQTSTTCLTLNFEVTGCKIDGESVNVTVKRSSGEADVGEIRLIFEKEDGSTLVVNQSEVPSELGTKLYSMNLGFGAKNVAVAPGISDSQGAMSYCNPTQPVGCN